MAFPTVSQSRENEPIQLITQFYPFLCPVIHPVMVSWKSSGILLNIPRGHFVNFRNMKEENGERMEGKVPGKCPYCDKTFSLNFCLVKHIRIHTGEKPFTCDICGKSFSDQSAFITHKRIHLTDENGQKFLPFFCHSCGKRFSRKTDLWFDTGTVSSILQEIF